MLIQGTNGDDKGLNLLVGTNGADTINGLEGSDWLYGLGSNDILVGGLGNDWIDGGGGNDTVSYLYSSSGVTVRLDLSAHVVDSFDDDTLVNVEAVWGSNHDDFLMGTSTADVLVGWAGDDLILGHAGADTISGGAGIDYASYGNSAVGVNINLATGTASGGDATGDKLSGIEVLLGSDYGDTLVGNGAANQLWGYGGNDTLRGGAGGDQIDGGLDKDILWGGKGADTFLYTYSQPQNSTESADVIKDFSEAQGDVIAFTPHKDTDFIGDAAFSAPGQLRVTHSGGDTFVAYNATGNSIAEFWIRLEGDHSLEANDFLL